MSSLVNKQKIPNQLVQLKQLGLLTDHIDNIIESYLPPLEVNDEYSKDNTKQLVNKITAENLAISNELITNFKPSISDQVKVGFYSTDRFTQTNESEIISLKSATETLEFLCNELMTVKYDLRFAKDSSKNQFNLELNNKTLEIYGKINEKFKEMKSQQNIALERIRKAYRSQLTNALTRVGQFTQQTKNYDLKQAKLKDESKKDEYLIKIKELQKTVFDLEVKNKNLQNELKLANDDAKPTRVEHDALINQLKDEKQRSIDELLVLNKKIGRLEEAISIKEEETEKLCAEVTNIQMQLEKEKIINEQYMRDLNELRLSHENEKQKIKKEYERQKFQMEAKLHDRIKESRTQILNAAKQELSQQENEVQRRQKQFEEQEKALKERLNLAEVLQKEKEKEAENISKISKKDDIEMITKLKKNELYLKSEIQRLKREIQKINEIWEKKFDILKKSLHTIKDEMYVRQNLQKQSVHMAYASVAYTTDEQIGVYDSSLKINNGKTINEKSILPSINNTSQKGGLERQLSFTVSLPSRLSGNLDIDDTQIIDDDEMSRIKDVYLKDFEFIKPLTYFEAEIEE